METVNLYVLTIAIVGECLPEEAFARYKRADKRLDIRRGSVLTDEDTRDMIKLREEQGLNLQELSEIYNITRGAISKRIHYFLRKEKEKGDTVCQTFQQKKSSANKSKKGKQKGQRKKKGNTQAMLAVL